MSFTFLTLLLIDALIGFKAGLTVELVGVTNAATSCTVEAEIGCTGGRLLKFLRNKRDERNALTRDK